ncbi:hypothetical protein [Vibrio mediterranei]|uniref:Uncharacterized protein n=1 Tax=Vibrio mediterranei TaxID=689 RepID=A0ABX5D5R1_9VIBR|nr:hypothetical protein [Vibrio mediterranei]PCD85369.1 hypothetical protein COR52_27140 [Vibrio mediterranei]PRQ64608.1 hypothetical protein COR51_26665 [Vibrio mediterranei]
MTDKTEPNSTEKRAREALVRLIDQKPTNRELKRELKAKGELKILVSNVELEAVLSNGTLKASRYPELRKDIKTAETERIHGPSDVPDKVVRKHPIYIEAKDKLDKTKDKVKKLETELALKDERLNLYKERLKAQAVRMHQMNVAMWEHIPDECKHVEVMIDVEKTGTLENIIAFKNRENLD